MSKKKFGKLFPDRIEMTIPDQNYFSVMLSESELIHIISCLFFTKRHCYFTKDVSCLDDIISYLNEFLKNK